MQLTLEILLTSGEGIRDTNTFVVIILDISIISSQRTEPFSAVQQCKVLVPFNKVGARMQLQHHGRIKSPKRLRTLHSQD